MSDAPATGDHHLVDLDVEFPRNELDTLINWGAQYLSSDNEDATIRAASLALEFARLAWANAKAHGRKMPSWQQRLIALGLVAQCVRERARQVTEAEGHTRH